MNKIFIEKCEEVFQFKNKKNIEEEELKNLQIIIGRTLIEEHRYILANYSAVFLKEGYEICSKYKSPMADEKGTEPFMYFLSLEGDDNIFYTYKMYKEQLPDSYYPIALADGGNIICINDNSDNVYIWIHDDVQNGVYKIFDSLEQMILMITKIEYEEEDFDEDEVEEIVLSDEFLTALNAIKK